MKFFLQGLVIAILLSATSVQASDSTSPGITPRSSVDILRPDMLFNCFRKEIAEEEGIVEYCQTFSTPVKGPFFIPRGRDFSPKCRIERKVCCRTDRIESTTTSCLLCKLPHSDLEEVVSCDYDEWEIPEIGGSSSGSYIN